MSKHSTRITRTELYYKIWSIPMVMLSKDFGISDVGLAKICKKHKIPTPHRGYWRKLECGLRPKQTPLPKIKDNENEIIEINSTAFENISFNNSQLTQLDVVSKFEKSFENRIIVGGNLSSLHPIVETTKAALNNASANFKGILVIIRSKALNIRVTTGTKERALLIADALVKALYTRGLTVSVVNREGKHINLIKVRNEELEILIEEKVRQRRRVLSEEEKEKAKKEPWILWGNQFEYIPSGVLSLKISEIFRNRIRLSWSDGKNQRLEDCLNDFITGLYVASLNKKLDRAQQEKEKLEWEEKERIAVEKRKVILQEEDKIIKLWEEVSQWQKSQQIRSYINAVKKVSSLSKAASETEREISSWIEWATNYADYLDPLKESPPSILDEKNKYFMFK